MVFSEQWLLEKQDLTRERGEDVKVLGEEDYQKLLIFFTNCKSPHMPVATQTLLF